MITGCPAVPSTHASLLWPEVNWRTGNITQLSKARLYLSTKERTSLTHQTGPVDVTHSIGKLLQESKILSSSASAVFAEHTAHRLDLCNCFSVCSTWQSGNGGSWSKMPFSLEIQECTTVKLLSKQERKFWEGLILGIADFQSEPTSLSECLDFPVYKAKAM